MAVHRLHAFFGEDLEDALDSLKSVPGAFGNICLAAIRQVRLIDLAALAMVVAGWAWLVGGYGVTGHHDVALIFLAILPTLLWLAAGILAGFIFHIGAIGVRSLAYWESYLLLLVFAVFGVVSLRIAIDPRGRRVYRNDPVDSDL